MRFLVNILISLSERVQWDDLLNVWWTKVFSIPIFGTEIKEFEIQAVLFIYLFFF